LPAGAHLLTTSPPPQTPSVETLRFSHARHRTEADARMPRARGGGPGEEAARTDDIAVSTAAA